MGEEDFFSSGTSPGKPGSTDGTGSEDKISDDVGTNVSDGEHIINADNVNRAQQLALLESYYHDCRRCPLHHHRTQVVFGTGNPDSPLMFVGEGPGVQEDIEGKPFVGRAGQLLTQMLAAIGIKRDEVYITNVVKCRPPGNRTPTFDEMMDCIPILRQQFVVMRPRILVTLGAAATQAIVDPKAKISQVRGKWVERKGLLIMPTYHPAFLLRNPAKKQESWEDLQKILAAYQKVKDM